MKKLLSYAVLMMGVLFLSTSAIFVKLANAPSAVTAFYRLVVALAVLVPIMLLNKSHRQELKALTKKQWGMCILSGVAVGVHYILWYESLRFTSVASSTVLVTMQPIFSIALGMLFLKEKYSKMALIGCGIALVGSVIISYGDFRIDRMAFIGDVLALAAAVVICAYFFIGQVARRSTSATVYSTLGYACAVVFLGIYAAIDKEPFLGYPLITWECFIGLGILSTILGQFIFNLLLKWLPAATVSMGIQAEPVGTCALAYFILGERIGLQQGIGIVVILGGLLIYLIAGMKKKPEIQETAEQSPVENTVS